MTDYSDHNLFTKDGNCFAHKPTASVLDAPIFPIYIPDEEEMLLTQTIGKLNRELQETERAAKIINGISAGADEPKLASSLNGVRPESVEELLTALRPKYETKGPDPAIGFLDEAANAMRARAALRDTPNGERTAGKIAKVFNAITGHNLTEEDAWLFLLVLKIVRSRSGKYSRDDYVDMSAYSALLGEHASTIPQ